LQITANACRCDTSGRACPSQRVRETLFQPAAPFCANLPDFAERLAQKEADIASAVSFDDLYRIVDSVTSPGDTIGALTIYDTALRLGYKRGILPDKVFTRGPGKKRNPPSRRHNRPSPSHRRYQESVLLFETGFSTAHSHIRLEPERVRDRKPPLRLRRGDKATGTHKALRAATKMLSVTPTD